mmetsp:Transcript_73805/g.173304  ORF Transcript_73805/g.173304 Transcript_73805/m.173304 type:complete len:262 (-) Transcript_73805:981-1766(-)
MLRVAAHAFVRCRPQRQILVPFSRFLSAGKPFDRPAVGLDDASMKTAVTQEKPVSKFEAAPGDQTQSPAADTNISDASMQAAVTDDQEPPRQRTARAVHTNIKSSIKKLEPVVEMVRRMGVEEALIQLKFLRKKVAKDVAKTVALAKNNARHAYDLNPNHLIIDQAVTGRKKYVRSIKYHAKGRASRIRTPYSQLTIYVREVDFNPNGLRIHKKRGVDPSDPRHYQARYGRRQLGRDLQWQSKEERWKWKRDPKNRFQDSV